MKVTTTRARDAFFTTETTRFTVSSAKPDALQGKMEQRQGPDHLISVIKDGIRLHAKFRFVSIWGEGQERNAGIFADGTGRFVGMTGSGTAITTPQRNSGPALRVVTEVTLKRPADLIQLDDRAEAEGNRRSQSARGNPMVLCDTGRPDMAARTDLARSSAVGALSRARLRSTTPRLTPPSASTSSIPRLAIGSGC